MNPWYENLQKPPLTPPGWVFGPVWTILYLMIALSLFLFFSSDRSEVGIWLYIILGVHLLANIFWSGLFFSLESPGWALVDILILDVTLIVLVVHFWGINMASSVLLWPYTLWVLFATYLNAGFVVLN
jgi:tryptophan-rich sensory protein